MRHDFSDFLTFVGERGGYFDAPLMKKFLRIQPQTAENHISNLRRSNLVIPSPYEFDTPNPKIFTLSDFFYIREHIYPSPHNHLCTIQRLISAHFALELTSACEMTFEPKPDQYCRTSKMEEIILYEKDGNGFTVIFVPTHSHKLYAEFEYIHKFHRQALEEMNGGLIVVSDDCTYDFFAHHPLVYGWRKRKEAGEAYAEVVVFRRDFWQRYKHYLYKNVPLALSRFRQELEPSFLELPCWE